MFTGLVRAVGRIQAAQPRTAGLRLTVTAPPELLRGAEVGDSIAVNGICLTAVEIAAGSFAADVSAETLAATTAGRWVAGRAVNLEPALAAGQPLGGHLMSGHVDGVGRLESRAPEGDSVRLRFLMPPELARYVARKGSIAVDGVSLTVNDVSAIEFGVNIVPHTLAQTTLGGLRPGDPVNLEVDLIARYLERLIADRT